MRSREADTRTMPRKGMRSLFFPSKSTLSTRSPSPLVRTLAFSESLVDDTVFAAAETIRRWSDGAYGGATLFSDGRHEVKEFLLAVRSLHEVMQLYVDAGDPTSHKFVGAAQSLMQAAMSRLQLELRRILVANRDLLDPETVSGHTSNHTTVSSFSDLDCCYSDSEARADSVREMERVSALAMSDIRLIAEGMISAGYGKECVDVYKSVRRSIVEEGLYRLGFEKMSRNQLHKLGADMFEHQIKIWLHAFKIAGKTLFASERILCGHVFASSDAVRESCFADVARDAAVDLLAFAELVATGAKRSPERVFRLLEVYDAVAELWPVIESTFSSDATAVVRAQAGAALSRLADAVRAALGDFESAVQKDSSKLPVPGGGVHPLTRYAMSYLGLLSDYALCLADIFVDWSPPVRTDLPETIFLDSSSSPISSDVGPESLKLAWLLLVIICKLDGKADRYKDVALAYLFLSNNLQYILSKVRTSNLRHLLGEAWLSQHEAKAQLYAATYERVAWSKVTSALPETPATSELSPEAAKVVFRKFNAAFDEATRRHSGWVVPSEKLRGQMKSSITQSIVPRYRDFCAKYRSAVQVVAEVAVVVRFSPEDVGNYLSDLFYCDELSIDSGSTDSSIRSHPSQ